MSEEPVPENNRPTPYDLWPNEPPEMTFAALRFAKVPKEKPTHLTALFAHGREENKCCGGTVVLRLGKSM